MDRYKDAFYSPLISDWRNFESWEEAGSPDALQRANKVYKQALEEYEEPALDTAVKEELEAFVTKRKQEGGVATDF
jgi:trimethylamine--corrinoid protein Co-methyltransferase